MDDFDADLWRAALFGIAIAERMTAAALAEADRLGLDLRQSDIAALLDAALTERNLMERERNWAIGL